MIIRWSADIPVDQQNVTNQLSAYSLVDCNADNLENELYLGQTVDRIYLNKHLPTLLDVHRTCWTKAFRQSCWIMINRWCSVRTSEYYQRTRLWHMLSTHTMDCMMSLEIKMNFLGAYQYTLRIRNNATKWEIRPRGIMIHLVKAHNFHMMWRWH